MSDAITFNLWPDGNDNNPAEAELRPRIEAYLPYDPPEQPLPAVIICPGGGYGRLAPHEGQPIARLLAENLVVGIVLTYRHAPHRYPAPLADICRAVRVARANAGQLHLDPERLAVMGFSAGGHLAATCATQPDLYQDPADDLAESYSARPDRLILAYPVISMINDYHQGSISNLLGEQVDDQQLREQLSAELNVDRQTPPTFIFHTADDAAVPVSNSIRFFNICRQNEVPAELHVYQSGPHGVGLATKDRHLRTWSDLLIRWLGDWAYVSRFN